MKTIALASGKGGTGKSCIGAYTGVALAKRGYRVLLIELGATARSLDLILGSEQDIIFDFSDVVAGRCITRNAIVPTAYHENLYLLPGPPLPSFFMPELGWLKEFLEDLEPLYDIILLDGVDFHALPPALVETILLVVTPDSLAIRAAAMYSRALFEAGATEVRLVINKVSPVVLPMYGARDFDDVIDTIGAQLIGVVPTSPVLEFSSNNAQKLEEEILPVEVFENIAARLLGERPHLLVK